MMNLQHRIVLLALPLLAACDNPAEDALRARMDVPDSTEFRDLRPCPTDPSITVGEYNSRNVLGLYAGFERFFYDASTGNAYIRWDAHADEIEARCFRAGGGDPIVRLDFEDISSSDGPDAESTKVTRPTE